MVSEKVYKNVMKYLVSGLSSRIQKYQKYIPLLKAYEKKSNSLRSDSAFFSYNAKILYSGTSTNSLKQSRTGYFRHFFYLFSHIPAYPSALILLILKSWLAGRGGL